jgi:hypothetical protein
MQGPGYDQESTPGLVAAGATAVIFTTGNGTTIGNAIAPVIKLASNNGVFKRMSQDIDISAGDIIEGTKSIAEVGTSVFEHLRDVASGDIAAKGGDTKASRVSILGGANRFALKRVRSDHGLWTEPSKATSSKRRPEFRGEAQPALASDQSRPADRADGDRRTSQDR